MIVSRNLRHAAAVIIVFVYSIAVGYVVTHAQQTDDLTALSQQVDQLYRAGSYAEAMDVAQRAVASAERQFGPHDAEVGSALSSLAALYRAQARYAEAESTFKRALAIDEKAPGPNQRGVARDLGGLASVYDAQSRYAEAEPLFKRALAIDEKMLGPDHQDVARDLSSLGALYRAQARYAEAESMFKRALAIGEKAPDPDHRDVARDLGSLASVYDALGRYTEAEPLFRRALAIDENVLGPGHPDVGRDLSSLAALHFAQNDWVRAADYWRGSTSIIIRRAQRGTPLGEALTGKKKKEATQLRWQFWGLVKVISRLASKQRDESGLPREMFQTAQWAQSSEAAESLAQMAARGAKGDPKLAGRVRQRQDLVAEWQRRDQVRIAALAEAPEKRDREAEAANIARITAIDEGIIALDRELAANFPDYAALANSAPLSVEEVQAQLGVDEALVLFLDTPEIKPTPEETFIWVVTKTDVKWVRSDLGTSALTREVSTLRCGLDYRGSWFDSHCSDLLKVNYTQADHDLFRKPLPFNLALAHQLYEELFGQIEDLIKDKRLLIVPSGPLTQLPFQVLVTEAPKIAMPTADADYRMVAWLARKQAITVLPAVSSVKALREYAKLSHATEPYTGFGNPLLDGDPDAEPDPRIKFAIIAAAKEAREKRCKPALRQRITSLVGPRGGTRPTTRTHSGVAADVRNWSPLPETADELCDVARDLRVNPAIHLHLGAKATEAEVNRVSGDGTLAKYRIVHFATHGALPGQVSHAAEPGLLLTPPDPDKASDADDGYLSASDIAGLKLDADWVILSACNTAAGDSKGAESLSGLARAFFYAGARSLLVSHWEVASKPTVKLITKAVDELKRHPTIGRAEAMRRSMLSMIDTGKDYEAHPAYWAPFVLVGEGGAAR